MKDIVRMENILVERVGYNNLICLPTLYSRWKVQTKYNGNREYETRHDQNGEGPIEPQVSLVTSGRVWAISIYVS